MKLTLSRKVHILFVYNYVITKVKICLVTEIKCPRNQDVVLADGLLKGTYFSLICIGMYCTCKICILYGNR